MRLFVLVVVWADQVLPPSVVATIAAVVPAPPLLPTAMQVEVLTHETPLSVNVVPELCCAQLAPPSVLVITVPFAPTATQNDDPLHEIPLSAAVVEFCSDQLPVVAASAGAA